MMEQISADRSSSRFELEGPGRTVDTDRDDVAALIEKLGLGSAEVVGWSFGGATALRSAIQHPEDVRRLVVISSPYAHSGWFPETREGMAQAGCVCGIS